MGEEVATGGAQLRCEREREDGGNGWRGRERGGAADILGDSRYCT